MFSDISDLEHANDFNLSGSYSHIILSYEVLLFNFEQNSTGNTRLYTRAKHCFIKINLTSFSLFACIFAGEDTSSVVQLDTMKKASVVKNCKAKEDAVFLKK